MPQRRRKVPFSGKAKKQQLQAKRQFKCSYKDNKAGGSSDDGTRPLRITNYRRDLRYKYPREDRSKDEEFNEMFKGGKGKVANNAVRVLETTIERKPESCLEVSSDLFFPDDMKFPVRPSWNYTMTKEQLNVSEKNYFRTFMRDELYRKSWYENLGHFDLNLEFWRQLWRVMELLDVAIVVADIRYAVLQFPPYLFKYIATELGKHVILVLNKIDLVPSSLVVAWKHYFRKTFPGIHIVTFSSYPASSATPTNTKSGRTGPRRKGKFKMAAEGALKLYTACKEIVGEDIDISSWQKKIMEELQTQGCEVQEPPQITVENANFDPAGPYKKFDGGVLTIGCIGFPNVGKSSIINALMGKKVVAVSRTPGRTKHFQTIFLTPEVRLCDCPGLVFPCLVSKSIQAISGSTSIAQLRNPYASVKYIADRLDLVGLLNLKHPENEETWTLMEICEAWAIKRGFYTAKKSRPDAYRAANHLLRMTLDGNIVFSFVPPGYFSSKTEWEEHEEVADVKRMQFVESSAEQEGQQEAEEDDEDEEEDEEELDTGNEGDESSSCVPICLSMFFESGSKSPENSSSSENSSEIYDWTDGLLPDF